MPPLRPYAKCALAVACCLALPPSRVFASGEQTIAPTIVTASRLNELGVADAATQGTITAAQLENRPLLRPAEVLEAVPGLIVTQHSGDGKANQYFLRGFNLDHGTDFRTTVAGMPVNMPTHAHGQGYSDLNFLIPELISQIRYKKGPYYAEQGDFAAAGAAEIDYVKDLKSGLGLLEAGSHQYGRVLVANSQKAGDGTLLYAFETARQNGPWEAPEHVEHYHALLRYSAGAGADTQWNVLAMAYKNRWNSTDQVPQRAIDSGLIARFGTIDTTDGGNTSRHSLSGEWERRGDTSVTKANAYAIDYRLNLFSNFTYFLDNPERGDQFEQADRRRVLGANVAHTRHAEWLGLSMEHTLGVQVRHDRIDPVGLYHTEVRQRFETVREDRVRQTGYSFYYQNGTQWLDKFRTIAGARADFYQFDVNSNIAANSGTDNDHIVSPKLSLIFGPWAKTEFYLNGGYGFHSNDARGSTLHVDPNSGEPAERVNPLVRAMGYEAGVRAQWLPGWQSALALWRLDLDSELLFVGDAGTTEASRPSRRQGIEWSNYWTPAKGVIVDADVAVSRSRFRGDDPAGNRVPGSIERTASVGLTYAGEGPWSGGLRLRYFGARPLLEDGSVHSAASTLVNLRLGYRMTRNLSVTVEVLNALERKVSDIDYYYASRLRGEPVPVADLHTHPAEPRTLRLSLAAHF